MVGTRGIAAATNVAKVRFVDLCQIAVMAATRG